MLLPRRVAGRMLGLHGPDLARGPEVALLWYRDRTEPEVWLLTVGTIHTHPRRICHFSFIPPLFGSLMFGT